MYCTVQQLKEYLGTTKATDDSFLQSLIARATARIDSHCQRKFSEYSTTRYFNAVTCVEGNVLYLDEDLLEVTSIVNGDGQAIAATEYILLPANSVPKWAIKLKSNSSVNWTYVDEPEAAIAVTGKWGFSSTPPDDIVHACIRLSAWYYHQTDAPFETQGLPEMGIVTIPADMPADLKTLLSPYIRSNFR